MKKRYQVFVSSTFDDLIEERKEVMQALLELRCIPAGMELFPAADDDQWTLIKSVIDDCDYYMVVIGGRYGSIGPGDLSYTELEYRYALDQGKPIIGFLHANPGKIEADKTEKSEVGRARLDSFRELVKQKTCKFWVDASDLGAKVSRGVINLMNTKPAIGWVRADTLSDLNAEEILKYRRRIDELEGNIAEFQVQPVQGDDLSQGDDQYKIHFEYSVVWGGGGDEEFKASINLTWNSMLGVLGPVLSSGASENDLNGLLSARIKDEAEGKLKQQLHDRNADVFSFVIREEDFHTILYQFKSLGIIAPVKDAVHRKWVLTPRGEQLLAGIKVVRRSS